MGVIADIIYNSFHYVYCDSCRYQGNIDDGCDGCHRKSMEWAISINTAKGLEKKILETITNESAHYHLNCPKCNYDWWDKDGFSKKCPRCGNDIKEDKHK